MLVNPMTLSEIEFLGTIEERKDELFQYLTQVRGFDLDEESFEECCKVAGSLETIDQVDQLLGLKQLEPEPQGTERRQWFRMRRSSFIPVFQGVMITNTPVVELKYRYIQEALDFALSHSPYQDLPDRQLTRKGQMKIFVHGGIGDECMFIAEQGYKGVEYGEVNGSEIQRYGGFRLCRRGLYDVPESKVSIECDPMGKGMYTTPEPWQDVVKQYDLIISSDIFGWIKHPIYTLMNLGRILRTNGVLALLPIMVDYPLKENVWMAIPHILGQFMHAMGFQGHKVAKDLYPFFTLQWASHTQKYYEEWLI